MSDGTFHKTPNIFSFQRGLVVTDGAMYNLIDGSYEDHPVEVIRHGIRGTQNVSATSDTSKDSARSSGNIQQTESAKLDPRAQALVVTFGIRMLDLASCLHACAGDTPEVSRQARASVDSFVQRAKAGKGLDEVAARMARNIANGSWLWRNRVIASEVTVEVSHDGKVVATFDALKVALNHFDNYQEAEKKLAELLVAGLRGDRQANLQVKATVKFGVTGSVEVFPSQAFLSDKPKGFARPLYKQSPRPVPKGSIDSVNVVGHAALRDQKISNRLKTIDTWYESDAAVKMPIPVEPNGANLDAMDFFRKSRTHSAFNLLAQLNKLDPDSDQGMFAIASLIRGGVYGSKDVESDVPKAPARAKDDAAEAAAA